MCVLFVDVFVGAGFTVASWLCDNGWFVLMLLLGTSLFAFSCPFRQRKPSKPKARRPPKAAPPFLVLRHRLRPLGVGNSAVGGGQG